MKIIQSHPGLELLGLHDANRIYWQLNTPQLYEESVQRHEGYVAHLGPLVVRTGNEKSLAYSDRFIVNEPPIGGDISWGEINRPMEPHHFDEILERMTAYFQGMDIFVQNCHVRVDQDSYLPIRVVTETAWHNLFVRNTYIHNLPTDSDESADFRPEYTILHAPGFRAIPERDGTNSDVFVILNIARGVILIGGTAYAGEIKKVIYSIANYLLPRRNVLAMECAVNEGENGDVAVFIGHAGTGKSSLAMDPSRTLIGDLEHGWSNKGIFSLTRGGYARLLGVSRESQPEIYDITRRFGTILENVPMDAQDRKLDLSNSHYTEHIRASYPISHIPFATRSGVAGHPDNIIILTRDAFGVLPPVAKLSPEQARYHYLSGYSSNLTTVNGKVEAEPAFSACFGAPFMPLHPGQYARLFEDRIRKHDAHVWLVNTGWVGGTYDNGERLTLSQTRSIINAILDGSLADVETVKEEYFDLDVPVHCPNVPDHRLNPADAWADKEAYAKTARWLVERFDVNSSQYIYNVDPDVLRAQPYLD